MVQQDNDSSCYRCGDSCYGDVVQLAGQYYHQYCFTCKKCNIDLVDVGYFEIDGEFYCNEDFNKIMGTKCDGCGKFIEGEAVTAMDSSFHQECFGCHSCGKLFPAGAKIIYDGEDFLCEQCDKPQSPKLQVKVEEPPPVSPPRSPLSKHAHANTPPYHPPQHKATVETRSDPPPYHQAPHSQQHGHTHQPVHSHQPPAKKTEQREGEENSNCCAGCGNDIKSGQALLALEKQWHLWCFTCHKCGCLLAGEYMGRDGVPYCEQDYQAEFGVTCAGCGGYITGKVLQAGEKHYHPHCSRCAKCGDMFGEGEEMYLQGSEIWHPHCSEEYQRENEELERAAVEAAKRNDSPPRSPQLRVTTRISPDHHSAPPIETYSFGMTEAQSPKRSPNVVDKRDHGSPPRDSKVNGSHYKQSSYSSEGSMDLKNNNVTQPPPYNDATKNRDNNKPAGFRSVRPPVTTTSYSQIVEKPPSPTESEDDAPPPIPPPPTRSSSTAWKQKYTGQQPRGVYTAKPFQKSVESSPPTHRRTNKPSMSFVDSAAARKNSDASHGPFTITANTKKATISITSTSRTVSTSSSNDGGIDERDAVQNDNFRKPAVRKGVGFNKLQLRKSLQDPKANGYPPAETTDPEIVRQLNSDGNTYPYEVLKTNSYKTPSDVNRKILETYLSDTEFHEVFHMTRDKFYSLPKWKQEEMKKKVTLF